MDPLALRERLAELFSRAADDPHLAGEVARARREFFGGETPDYVADEAGLDAAAQRFAEWFLLERESEVLGEVPLRVFDAGRDADLEPLHDSRQGLFLVESGAAGDDREGALLRDLEDGERLRAVAVAGELNAGDLLVGRLFAVDDSGAYVPSAGAAVVGGAAQLAVAFQRDVRQQQLERRLLQVEVEHLVHRRLAEDLPGPELQTDERPAEHLEAELQQILVYAGVEEDELSATQVSNALRARREHPGEVIGPLLDQLAFETDIDLDHLRELLLGLWNAHRSAEQNGAGAPAAAPPPAATPPPADPAQPPPAGTPRPFTARPDEGLGSRLARRIEQGLADRESVGDLFADVERMIGEPLDDDDESQGRVGSELGDLEAWSREFAWEASLDAAEEARLGRLVSVLRDAPVPRDDVESLETGDLFRFLLLAWLARGPGERVAELRASAALVQRFLDWVAETQLVDVRDRLQPACDALLGEPERLDAAGRALSSRDHPESGSADAGQLLRVVDVGPVAMHVAEPGGSAEVQVPLDAEAVSSLRTGDLLIAPLRETGPGHGRLGDYVVVLPGAAEPHLTGA